jgi:hypothetical protein
VLALIAEHGLVKGDQIGVDASTMEANAALRAIVRRDSGETYRDMLNRMAAESGIETPSAEDLVRLDRKRKGKTLSNADWVSESATDPEAKIAKMKVPHPFRAGKDPFSGYIKHVSAAARPAGLRHFSSAMLRYAQGHRWSPADCALRQSVGARS